jgi:hypothetical protein
VALGNDAIDVLGSGLVIQDVFINGSGDKGLVEKRWIIKTSSGEIARSANWGKYVREFCGH